MLQSVKIQRRQSEIRQSLAELAGKDTPSEDEVRQMGDLDREYQTGEVRYRAALVSEDEERREAGADLETRAGESGSRTSTASEPPSDSRQGKSGKAASGS